MKKFAAFILAILMISALCLSGCSSQPVPAQSPSPSPEASESPAPEADAPDENEPEEPAEPEEPEEPEEPAENVITVKDTDEFISALVSAVGEETVIELEPGVYNLTEWLNENEAEYIDFEHPMKGIFRNDVFDGDQLVISGVNGLTIRSADTSWRAEIVVEPRYAQVLYFYNCDDLTVDNLIMGHTPDKGNCTGNVIYLENCSNALVRGTELFGCGAYAAEVWDCSDLTFDDCLIHECTYGCMLFYYSHNVNVLFTEFSDCEEYTMLELSSADVLFDNCIFKRLNGNLISADEYSAAQFKGCIFDNDAEMSLEENPDYPDRITVS